MIQIQKNKREQKKRKKKNRMRSKNRWPFHVINMKRDLVHVVKVATNCNWFEYVRCLLHNFLSFSHNLHTWTPMVNTSILCKALYSNRKNFTPNYYASSSVNKTMNKKKNKRHLITTQWFSICCEDAFEYFFQFLQCNCPPVDMFAIIFEQLTSWHFRTQ